MGTPYFSSQPRITRLSPSNPRIMKGGAPSTRMRSGFCLHETGRLGLVAGDGAGELLLGPFLEVHG